MWMSRRWRPLSRPGAMVMLFFCSHHDEKNTIESEVKKIEAFRAKVQEKCVCMVYNAKMILKQL
jgi:hypothetical protein